ncbi:MAG TPA: hypothetical protein PK879_08650 [Opitutaceae bacterium]|nr:hypothetical protein [Opitutaceae bacterium]HQL22047.1 hypothetical protein [Opitutaceae bacterium]
MNDAKHALAFLVVGVAMWVVSGMEGVTGASVARVLWLQIMGVLQACIGAGRMAVCAWTVWVEWMALPAVSEIEAEEDELLLAAQSSEPCSDVSDLSPMAS